MHYTGLKLDRAPARRTDPAWVAEQRTAPGTRVVPLWRDRVLVREGSPVAHGAAAAAGLMEAADGEPVLLGLDDGRAVFAVDLSGLEEAGALAAAGADGTEDVRALVPVLTDDRAGLLAYARGLLHWHRNQRFCGACGSPSSVRDGGHLRVCDGCGKLLFPRIEPAVICLVELAGDPNRCLLARHAGSGPDAFSTLAGFVEIGEGLEDAVRREMAEEAGVTVKDVDYRGSQSWPFPAGLMIGFRAQAVSEEIAVDGRELEEARWFTAGELRALIGAGRVYRRDSIGKFLIESWIAENTRD